MNTYSTIILSFLLQSRSFGIKGHVTFAFHGEPALMGELCVRVSVVFLVPGL